jgi:hypothetical protein
MPQHQRSSLPDGRYRRLSRYVFFGFVAVAGFFLLAEHRAHVVPFLPFLLLAACPLMHLFHHRGHKRGSDGSDSESPPSSTAGGAHRH